MFGQCQIGTWPRPADTLTDPGEGCFHNHRAVPAAIDKGVFNVQPLLARRLAASVSLAAVSVVLSTPALGATTEGVRQDDSGTIAINVLEFAAGDPPAEFGTVNTASNPGGLAQATASVTCALSATCPNPGAVEQVASGVDTAENELVIDGKLVIEAIAAATGDSAGATAYIDTAVYQLAQADGQAINQIDISGTLSAVASAQAHGEDGPARADAWIPNGMVARGHRRDRRLDRHRQ